MLSQVEVLKAEEVKASAIEVRENAKVSWLKSRPTMTSNNYLEFPKSAIKGVLCESRRHLTTNINIEKVESEDDTGEIARKPGRIETAMITGSPASNELKLERESDVSLALLAIDCRKTHATCKALQSTITVLQTLVVKENQSLVSKVKGNRAAVEKHGLAVTLSLQEMRATSDAKLAVLKRQLDSALSRLAAGASDREYERAQREQCQLQHNDTIRSLARHADSAACREQRMLEEMKAMRNLFTFAIVTSLTTLVTCIALARSRK